MTISHRLEEDELAQATVDDLYSALGSGDTPRLFASRYRVDALFDIPNGGGCSLDRRVVYIDRTLHQECMDGAFKSSGLTPQQIIDRWCDHEFVENCILAGDNAVDSYYPAHERALRFEHQGVLAVLGRKDAEAKIRAYEEAIWPALLRCYHRPIQRPPLDLWCGPNLDDPSERDDEILRQLARAGCVDATKHSKYAVHYGIGKHHCRHCRFFSPKTLSQEHGEIAACEAVSGTVRDERGCDLWQKADKAEFS